MRAVGGESVKAAPGDLTRDAPSTAALAHELADERRALSSFCFVFLVLCFFQIISRNPFSKICISFPRGFDETTHRDDDK